jgi:hypothetical protein
MSQNGNVGHSGALNVQLPLWEVYRPYTAKTQKKVGKPEKARNSILIGKKYNTLFIHTHLINQTCLPTGRKPVSRKCPI